MRLETDSGGCELDRACHPGGVSGRTIARFPAALGDQRLPPGPVAHEGLDAEIGYALQVAIIGYTMRKRKTP